MLPVALVSVTLTGQASCGGRVCDHKVTAELPAINQKLVAAVPTSNKELFMTWALELHMIN